jgi:hypothetical protein
VAVEARRGEAKRAWPRRVEIESDLPGGVNAVAMRGLPIRQVMGYGVGAIHQVTVLEAGMAQVVPVEGLDPEATRLMAELVGYIGAEKITEGLSGEGEA